MKTQLRRLQDQARQEWHGNPRFRMGAWAVLGIFLFYGVLVISDWREAQALELNRLEARLEQTREVLEEADWPARAEEASQRHEALRGRFWQAESTGIARAELESWLREKGEEAGFSRIQVQVDSAQAVDGQDNIWRISARIESRQVPGVVRPWLASLQESEKMLLVEELEIQRRGPARLMTWVTAWFELPGEEDE